MKWKYRRYKLWVISTQTVANLYLWEKWKLLLPSLDMLIHLTTEPAFIRSFQSYEFENRWLGFGRMKWNEENNMKWTTKYRNRKAGGWGVIRYQVIPSPTNSGTTWGVCVLWSGGLKTRLRARQMY